MPIASYLEVITLAQASAYLRIDHDLTAAGLEDERADVEQMIAAALSFIERKTNHVFITGDKNYYLEPGTDRVLVYDYPVNAVQGGLVEDDDYLVDQKSKYRVYRVLDSDTVEQGYIILNVGYDAVADIPAMLVQLAKQYLKQLYFEQEGKAPTGAIPGVVKEGINQYKRFLV